MFATIYAKVLVIGFPIHIAVESFENSYTVEHTLFSVGPYSLKSLALGKTSKCFLTKSILKASPATVIKSKEEISVGLLSKNALYSAGVIKK